MLPLVMARKGDEAHQRRKPPSMSQPHLGAADPADIEIIHELFGSRAQTIINALLAFDAYFKWYYSYKREACHTYAAATHRTRIRKLVSGN